jgi:hypothetical protein
MPESIGIPIEGGPTLEALSEALTRAGFRVSRSFDLRSAMEAQGSCICPDHGTEACTCQFAVLLAYALPTGSPAVITAHSSGPATYVSFVEEPGRVMDSAAAERAMAAVMKVAGCSAHARAGATPKEGHNQEVLR